MTRRAVCLASSSAETACPACPVALPATWASVSRGGDGDDRRLFASAEGGVAGRCAVLGPEGFIALWPLSVPGAMKPATAATGGGGSGVAGGVACSRARPDINRMCGQSNTLLSSKSTFQQVLGQASHCGDAEVPEIRFAGGKPVSITATNFRSHGDHLKHPTAWRSPSLVQSTAAAPLASSQQAALDLHPRRLHCFSDLDYCIARPESHSAPGQRMRSHVRTWAEGLANPGRRNGGGLTRCSRCHLPLKSSAVCMRGCQ